MTGRLVRGAVAAVLLLAFVADLRFVAPVVAVVLAAAAWRRLLPRTESVAGAVVLAAAALAFQLDAEVPAWTLVLAAAAGLGFAAAAGRTVVVAADQRP